MKGADVLDADVLQHVVDGALVRVVVAQLVSGREDVAGVEADADPLFVVHEPDHLPELFERAADATPLAGCGLEQRHHAMIGDEGVHLIQRSRDLVDARGGARTEVRAGVEDDGVGAETLGTIQLVGHGGDRLLEKQRVRGGQVDQIGRVREHGPAVVQ